MRRCLRVELIILHSSPSGASAPVHADVTKKSQIVGHLKSVAARSRPHPASVGQLRWWSTTSCLFIFTPSPSPTRFIDPTARCGCLCGCWRAADDTYLLKCSLAVQVLLLFVGLLTTLSSWLCLNIRHSFGSLVTMPSSPRYPSPSFLVLPSSIIDYYCWILSIRSCILGFYSIFYRLRDADCKCLYLWWCHIISFKRTMTDCLFCLLIFCEMFIAFLA